MKHLKLNIHLIHEALQTRFHKFSLHPGCEIATITDFRIYQPGMPLVPEYLYIVTKTQIPGLAYDSVGLNFLTNKKVELFRFPIGCSVLTVEDSPSFSELINAVQEVFQWYRTWEQALYDSLKSDNPLDEMIEASLPVFRNPVFIHDASFYILTCPHQHPRLSHWERDAKSGRLMVPLQLINDFKMDLEYLNTLNTKKADLYSAEQRSYPLLYMNLWNEERYEGRICVAELESPILPGQYHLIEFLAEFILDSIHNKSLFWMSFDKDTEHFLLEFLQGEMEDQTRIQRCLFSMNWNRSDHFLCLRLEPELHHNHHFSASATMNYIEAIITDCHAFFYDGGIAVIINLSKENKRPSDVLSSLAVLIRDSLLKMGVSTVVTDFMYLPKAYYQAVQALALGIQSGHTNWYYRFDQYLLDFVLQKSGEHLPPELLCSAKLQLLKQYDQENNTEFFLTLKTYLNLERNVLQTAKTLYIHRSTLFYRLERIRKITGLNLDDPRERLTLSLSFYIMERS